MNSPCKNCLMIPVCRNKLLSDLKRECSLARKFIEDSYSRADGEDSYYNTMTLIIKDLKTSKFSVLRTLRGVSLRQEIKPKFRGKRYVTV